MTAIGWHYNGTGRKRAARGGGGDLRRQQDHNAGNTCLTPCRRRITADGGCKRAPGLHPSTSVLLLGGSHCGHSRGAADVRSRAPRAARNERLNFGVDHLGRLILGGQEGEGRRARQQDWVWQLRAPAEACRPWRLRCTRTCSSARSKAHALTAKEGGPHLWAVPQARHLHELLDGRERREQRAPLAARLPRVGGAPKDRHRRRHPREEVLRQGAA